MLYDIRYTLYVLRFILYDVPYTIYALYDLKQTMVSGQVNSCYNSLHYLARNFTIGLNIVIMPTILISLLFLLITPALMTGLGCGTGQHERNQEKCFTGQL